MLPGCTTRSIRYQEQIRKVKKKFYYKHKLEKSGRFILVITIRILFLYPTYQSIQQRSILLAQFEQNVNIFLGQEKKHIILSKFRQEENMNG